LLAKEFYLSDLAAECAAFSVSVDQFVSLSKRVSELERQASSSVATRPSQIEERIESQEEELEHLRLAVGQLKTSVTSELSTLKSGLEERRRTKVEIPMNEDDGLDGIISYLTRRHRGNVQEKGIVTITSLSVHRDDPRYGPSNVADLTSDAYFRSKKERGQWIGWNFGEMRVRPTHYTITARALRSWAVLGSVDGEHYTVMDVHNHDQDFRQPGFQTASFAVATSMKCRFISVASGDRHNDDELILRAVEFFGTLSE
jgi:hypothetical protein